MFRRSSQAGVGSFEWRNKAHLQHGSALILVLWVIALLGLLMTGVISTLRLQNQKSHDDLQRSRALIAAEAGMALAVERLLVEPGSLVANGQVYPFEFDGVRLNVSIRSEHGKLDLNFASQEKISSLMRFMGATPQQSTLIASQLQNRRNEGRPLRYLEELLDATSISVDLYQRVLPFVTLWSGRGVPDAAFAAQPLRNALSLEAPRRRVGNPGSALSIESSAKLASGSKFVLLTTLVLGADVESGHLYRIVKWQEQ